MVRLVYIKIVLTEKRGIGLMVNKNFEKFRDTEMKHQGVYLGKNRNNQKPGINDDDYNNQSNTDKSVGAAGRKL